MATQKHPSTTDEVKEDTHAEEDELTNYRDEVVVIVAWAIVAGQTYSQIEAGLRRVGVHLSMTETEMAMGCAIHFLRDGLERLPEDVADFLAKAELPLPRDLVLGLAHNLPPFKEMIRP